MEKKIQELCLLLMFLTGWEEESRQKPGEKIFRAWKGYLFDVLNRQALDESCYPMQIMLQWFIKEQVEEEATAAQIVHELTRVKDSPQGLWMINRELAARKAS